MGVVHAGKSLLATVTAVASAQSLFDAELLKFAELTVAIEVPLFWLCGYRKLGDCLFFASVNIISNLLLNEFLLATDATLYWRLIVPCEVAVVLLEFTLCTYRFEACKKLLRAIVFTNATSFLLGLAL